MLYELKIEFRLHSTYIDVKSTYLVCDMLIRMLIDANASIHLDCSAKAAFNAVCFQNCHVEEQRRALLAQNACKQGIFHILFGAHWAVTIETNHV